jgi:hypothetical protein
VADSVVFVLVALDGSVIEDELVDDDGVFVRYVSINDDSVLGRRELLREVEVMANSYREWVGALELVVQYILNS